MTSKNIPTLPRDITRAVQYASSPYFDPQSAYGNFEFIAEAVKSIGMPKKRIIGHVEATFKLVRYYAYGPNGIAALDLVANVYEEATKVGSRSTLKLSGNGMKKILGDPILRMNEDLEAYVEKYGHPPSIEQFEETLRYHLVERRPSRKQPNVKEHRSSRGSRTKRQRQTHYSQS